jgi:hypothetical protein
VNNSAAFFAVAMAAFAAPAVAHPTGDTAKYQPAISDARACIRGNAPPANIAGIRNLDEAFLLLKDRCYVSFDAALTKLGAGNAAPGSFRLLIREGWAAFGRHINSR